mgnify:CR=1 FL=1
MKKRFPLIGVSGSMDKDETQYFIMRSYMQALTGAGGVPVLLCPDMNSEQLESCVNRLDGLLLAGGNDLAPSLFHQAPLPALGEVNPLRDQLELRLIAATVERRLPVLGICRGIQVMNVAMGGSLWQDLPSQNPSAFGHRQNCLGQYPSHQVEVVDGSLLRQIVGQDRLAVNSFHHQAVKEAAAELSVCAYAPDGVIEAVEHPSLPFFLGVQWHPERTVHTDDVSRAIFSAFVQAACQIKE